jgi:hypothetical protein
MTRFSSHRWASVAVIAVAMFATANAAQPPRPTTPNDPLELAKVKQKLAEQKAETEVNDVLKAADQQAKFNMPKAVQILKNARTDLQFASIGEATRTRLTNLLDAKIAVLEGRPANPNPTNPGTKIDPKAAETKAAKKLIAEKYFAELKDVREGIDRIKDYEAKGQREAANTEIARLTKSYPNNPAVIVLGQTDSIATRLADADAFNKLYAQRMVKVQNDINKSALPAVTDVEFPSDWKEKSERRLKATMVQLSAKEKKIIESLDKPISVNFRDRPFEDVLQELSNLLDQPLLLDKKSLEALELDLKKASTLQANGLSGRTVLRSILATQGLTFVVKDEAIQVVTVERARNLLTTRVYYLGDLINGTGPFGGIQWGPFLNMQQTQANAEMLVAMIKKSIDPLSWNGEAGGAGSVTFHYPSMSIIVRASTEVHHTLGTTFYGRK